jgi:LysM repeat protein
MSLQEKYGSVVALAKEMKVQALNVAEEAGKLKLSGVANTVYEKNLIWDKIKNVGGEVFSDITADISVANKDQLKNPDMIQVGQKLKIPTL